MCEESQARNGLVPDLPAQPSARDRVRSRQILMAVFAYLPGPLARFQILSRRHYEAVVPQWLGPLMLAVHRKVLARPGHASDDQYSFPDRAYWEGLGTQQKNALRVRGIRYCASQASLELELSTGLKSHPSCPQVYQQFPDLQIVTVTTVHNFEQRWIVVQLRTRDGQQHSFGATAGLTNSYTLQPGEHFIGVRGSRYRKRAHGAIYGAEVMVAFQWWGHPRPASI